MAKSGSHSFMSLQMIFLFLNHLYNWFSLNHSWFVQQFLFAYCIPSYITCAKDSFSGKQCTLILCFFKWNFPNLLFEKQEDRMNFHPLSVLFSYFQSYFSSPHAIKDSEDYMSFVSGAVILPSANTIAIKKWLYWHKHENPKYFNTIQPFLFVSRQFCKVTTGWQ